MRRRADVGDHQSQRISGRPITSLKTTSARVTTTRADVLQARSMTTTSADGDAAGVHASDTPPSVEGASNGLLRSTSGTMSPAFHLVKAPFAHGSAGSAASGAGGGGGAAQARQGRVSASDVELVLATRTAEDDVDGGGDGDSDGDHDPLGLLVDFDVSDTSILRCVSAHGRCRWEHRLVVTRMLQRCVDEMKERHSRYLTYERQRMYHMYNMKNFFNFKPTRRSRQYRLTAGELMCPWKLSRSVIDSIARSSDGLDDEKEGDEDISGGWCDFCGKQDFETHLRCADDRMRACVCSCISARGCPTEQKTSHARSSGLIR